MLSGPSGVGKSTVIRRLKEICPDIWLSVSVTTRRPRPTEVDGREYYFATEDDFDCLVAAGELLEWASFVDHRHGTPRTPVEAKLAVGIPVLLEIDLAGARQVRRAVPDALLVFLAPPSWDELVRRLNSRGTEPPEIIEGRLAAARQELAAEPEFDVSLVNTSVEEVADRLVSLVLGQVSQRELPREFTAYAQAARRGPVTSASDTARYPEGTTWQRRPPQKASPTRRLTSSLRSSTASTAS